MNCLLPPNNGYSFYKSNKTNMAENSKPAVTSMDEFLVDVIVKVLQSQPANPLNSFGRISDFILEKSYTPNKKTNDLLPCLPYTKVLQICTIV